MLNISPSWNHFLSAKKNKRWVVRVGQMQGVLSRLLSEPWLSWTEWITIPPCPAPLPSWLSPWLLGNHCMPVCSPPQGKKIGGDSVMESPVDLSKWVDKVSLYTTWFFYCCTARNGQYNWDQSCGLNYQLYIHTVYRMHTLTSRRRLWLITFYFLHFKPLLTMRTSKSPERLLLHLMKHKPTLLWTMWV